DCAQCSGRIAAIERSATQSPAATFTFKSLSLPLRSSIVRVVETSSSVQHATWRDYYELGKPRVVMLIVFTAIVGMFLAAPGLPPVDRMLFGTLGIALQAASAAAINQLIDRNIDARMARTCGRPLVTGTLSIAE